MKANDEWARGAKDADVLEEMPLSVVSGRSIPEIAGGKGRKRVWHSNRSGRDNVKAGAVQASASVQRASAPRSASRMAHGARRAAAKPDGKRNKRNDKESGPRGARLPDPVTARRGSPAFSVRRTENLVWKSQLVPPMCW